MQIDNLSWFPGHMTKTKRMMEKCLPLVDAVVEVIDTRVPMSSRNPDINVLTAGKPRIIVMNKCDAADEKVTSQWIDYFRRQGGGHLAAISSIAGTKGLGAAAAYSASKRYQNTYLDALAQLSRMQRLDIRITDIRPGFVDTPLLREGKYPMLMRPEKVAARIVRALEQRKRRIVIDRRYAVLVFFWRLIPEWLWERLPIRTK